MHARSRRLPASVILTLLILITAATPATAVLISPGTIVLPAKTCPVTLKPAFPTSTATAGAPSLLLQPAMTFSSNGNLVGSIHFYPGRVTPQDCILVESKDLTPSGSMTILPDIAPIHSNPGLEEVTWHLTAYGSSDAFQRVLDGTTVTLVFDRLTQKVTGTSGCNLVYASYHAGKGKVSISGLGSTKMYCTLPNGVMDQEQRFLDILGQATTYSLSGHTLTLTTGSGLALTFSD